MSKQNKPWTIQWHIAADGTVIRQRSKGDQPHQQLYGSYTTTRQMEMSELDALDERVARTVAFFNVLTKVVMAVVVVDVAAVVVGIILRWSGVEVGTAVVTPAVVLFIVLLISLGGVHGLMINRFNRAWTEAGFESSNHVTMAASEARAMIEAPGAVSGRRTRVERA